MPTRAFVPVPLLEAQPRVYKSFRGRQLRGILLGLGGATLGLVAGRSHDLAGYAVAFVLALPGFAYGYYQPQGRPVEYWLRVLTRYYTTPQIITASALVRRPRWKVYLAQIGPIITAAWRSIRPQKNLFRERGARG